MHFPSPQTWPIRRYADACQRLSRCSSQKNSPTSVSSFRRSFLLRHWETRLSRPDEPRRLSWPGHGRDAGGNSDETTGAGCGCAGGSDINDDRHRRSKEALHDLLRRIEQTSWRVKLNDKTLSILRSGFADAARNIARRGRPNRSVDIDKGNLLRRENRGRASKAKNQRSDAHGGASSTSPSTRCRF